MIKIQWLDQIFNNMKVSFLFDICSTALSYTLPPDFYKLHYYVCTGDCVLQKRLLLREGEILSLAALLNHLVSVSATRRPKALAAKFQVICKALSKLFLGDVHLLNNMGICIST